MMCHLVTTPDIEQATKFEGVDAFVLWRTPDPRAPVRDDGKPNRPLTAFTVEIEEYPSREEPVASSFEGLRLARSSSSTRSCTTWSPGGRIAG